MAKSGDIAALVMEDGSRIEGDLFVDCTGFRSVLVGQKLETPFEDWLHWLPNDCAWATQSESVEPAYPYTRSIAHGAGWQWRIPLQQRMGRALSFRARISMPIRRERSSSTVWKARRCATHG